MCCVDRANAAMRRVQLVFEVNLSPVHIDARNPEPVVLPPLVHVRAPLESSVETELERNVADIAVLRFVGAPWAWPWPACTSHPAVERLERGRFLIVCRDRCSGRQVFYLIRRRIALIRARIVRVPITRAVRSPLEAS